MLPIQIRLLHVNGSIRSAQDVVHFDPNELSRKGKHTAQVESTREKPMEKFSTLAERASHLRKFLPMKAEVVPVVVTAANIVMSEAEAAVEHHLGLIGAKEIQRLLGLNSTPGTTANSFLDYIKPRETVADQILRTTSDLSRLG